MLHTENRSFDAILFGSGEGFAYVRRFFNSSYCSRNFIEYMYL